MGECVYVIKDLVEVGVLLLLCDSGLFVVDVMIGSDVLCVGVCVVLDVLVVQVGVVGVDVGMVFVVWCGIGMGGLEKFVVNMLVSVVVVVGCLMLVVDLVVVGKVVGLFVEQWCSYVLGCSLQVSVVGMFKFDGDQVFLSWFGNIVGIMDVVICVDCSVSFDLGVLLVDGCLFE